MDPDTERKIQTGEWSVIFPDICSDGFSRLTIQKARMGRWLFACSGLCRETIPRLSDDSREPTPGEVPHAANSLITRFDRALANTLVKTASPAGAG